MKIEVWQGDIMILVVDVIVNVVNEFLFGGGGVDGVIYCVVGLVLFEVCWVLLEICLGMCCLIGEVCVIDVYDLLVCYVFYIVGLVWQDGQCDELVLFVNCYWKLLQLVEKLDLQLIVFLVISCGVFGYLLYQVVQIVVIEILIWQCLYCQLCCIILVVYNVVIFKVYQQVLVVQGQLVESLVFVGIFVLLGCIGLDLDFGLLLVVVF